MTNLNLRSSARLLGKMRLGHGVYIAQGAILRSMEDSIKIANSSWVLENSVLIGTLDHPLEVGSKTVFGHKSIAIGTKIGNLCEIGNGTIFLPGSVIGDCCIFGEGTLIPEGTVIPERSVVVGRPGRVIRKLTDHDLATIKRMRKNNIELPDYTENIVDNEIRGNGSMGNLYKFGDKAPQVASTATLYDTAELTGDVTVGENSIIGSGVRIIGDTHGPVRIGNNVQILENTVLHLLPDNELIIRDNVTIGPGCIIHGTIIGEGSIVESGAIVCDYSSLGKNTIVRSGSLVKQRSSFQDNQILEGFPAKPVDTSKTSNERPLWAFQKKP